MSSRACCLGFALLLLAQAGCFDALDLTGRRCPCDQGWVCVADRCVEEGSEPQDAGEDVGGLLPVDAGQPACPLGAFCEDFESPFPGANGWTPLPDLERVRYLGPSDLPLVPVRPYRGSGMAWVSTLNLAGQAQLEICPFEGFVCPTALPAPGTELGIVDGDIYLRAYVLAPTNLTSGNPFVMGHASVLFMGAHQGPFAAGESVVGFNLDADRVSMYVGTDLAVGRIEPRPASGPDDRPVFARDTWTCVRVHIHVDATLGSVATYIGSDEVPEVERIGTSGAPLDTVPDLPFLHFGLGLGYTDEMVNGAELYFDDVAVSRAPVPCLE